MRAPSAAFQSPVSPGGIPGWILTWTTEMCPCSTAKVRAVQWRLSGCTEGCRGEALGTCRREAGTHSPLQPLCLHPLPCTEPASFSESDKPRGWGLGPCRAHCHHHSPCPIPWDSLMGSLVSPCASSSFPSPPCAHQTCQCQS